VPDFTAGTGSHQSSTPISWAAAICRRAPLRRRARSGRRPVQRTRTALSVVFVGSGTQPAWAPMVLISSKLAAGASAAPG
jgi:hypothetical protein